MMSPADVVREFHERMQQRDWDGAAVYLSPTIDIRFPSTGERFVGPNFLTMNRVYPDGWSLSVEEVIAVGDRVASRVRVEQGDEVFWCAGFYTVTNGVIADGIEHWLTTGAEVPPAWRAPLSSPS
jgi:SnoaL-like domain